MEQNKGAETPAKLMTPLDLIIYNRGNRALLPQNAVRVEPLKGKHLACWCAPKRCHAETLRRLANE